MIGPGGGRPGKGRCGGVECRTVPGPGQRGLLGYGRLDYGPASNVYGTHTALGICEGVDHGGPGRHVRGNGNVRLHGEVVGPGDVPRRDFPGRVVQGQGDFRVGVLVHGIVKRFLFPANRDGDLFSRLDRVGIRCNSILFSGCIIEYDCRGLDGQGISSWRWVRNRFFFSSNLNCFGGCSYVCHRRCFYRIG